MIAAATQLAARTTLAAAAVWTAHAIPTYALTLTGITP